MGLIQPEQLTHNHDIKEYIINTLNNGLNSVSSGNSIENFAETLKKRSISKEACEKMNICSQLIEKVSAVNAWPTLDGNGTDFIELLSLTGTLLSDDINQDQKVEAEVRIKSIINP